jgi:hypothetical protein
MGGQGNPLFEKIAFENKQTKKNNQQNEEAVYRMCENLCQFYFTGD